MNLAEDALARVRVQGQASDVRQRPPQIAPYHLRLDWLMWFAAMSPSLCEHPWLAELLTKLLAGDPATLGLLKTNPFPDRPPRLVRVLSYRYRFTTPGERRRSGAWWQRDFVGEYVPPIGLNPRR